MVSAKPTTSQAGVAIQMLIKYAKIDGVEYNQKYTLKSEISDVGLKVVLK